MGTYLHVISVYVPPNHQHVVKHRLQWPPKRLVLQYIPQHSQSNVHPITWNILHRVMEHSQTISVLKCVPAHRNSRRWRLLPLHSALQRICWFSWRFKFLHHKHVILQQIKVLSPPQEAQVPHIFSLPVSKYCSLRFPDFCLHLLELKGCNSHETLWYGELIVFSQQKGRHKGQSKRTPAGDNIKTSLLTGLYVVLCDQPRACPSPSEINNNQTANNSTSPAYC